ncbi:MAG TPA: DUF3048 domain-containing protein [Acidimicrobiia bacterium]|nr:DUF3048 domain-containing protein [Acidimicrobiia bacterium]
MTTAFALLAGFALVASACGAGGSAKSAGSSSTTTTTLAPPSAPLTGLVDPSGVAQGRGALIVKIENTPAARPQSGLELADVVYEEVVDGGITRLMAVFNSQTPETVGPIRSVRPVDASLAQPIGGVLAYSGGLASEVARIESVPGLITVSEDTAGDAMFRDRARAAPHDLYGYPDALWAFGGEPVPPRPLFEYLGDGETFAGEPVDSFTVGESTDADYNPTYDWNPESGTWLRSLNGEPSTTASGSRIAPTNVVIQFTTYVPEPGAPGAVGQVTGAGEAWVLTAGRLVRGTWTRDDPALSARYADGVGRPIKLAPGRTWVSLAALGLDTELVVPPAVPDTAGPPTAPGS